MVRKRSNSGRKLGKSYDKHKITKYNLIKQQEKLVNRRNSSVSHIKSSAYSVE